MVQRWESSTSWINAAVGVDMFHVLPLPLTLKKTVKNVDIWEYDLSLGLGKISSCYSIHLEDPKTHPALAQPSIVFIRQITDDVKISN